MLHLGPVSEDAERARFEAWILKRYPDSPSSVARNPDMYNHFQVEFAWQAWMAALTEKENTEWRSGSL